MVDVCTLPSRGVFRLSGPEARDWLQGLVTNDVEAITPDRALYTALLTPQGKILFDFFVYDTGDSLLVDCEGAQKAALMKRLRLYKLRSDVTISDEPEIGVVSSCTPFPGQDSPVHQSEDPRNMKLGVRILGNAKAIGAGFQADGVTVQTESQYRDYLLGLGIPNRPEDFPSDKAYPLECNFAELNGVSFTKGCFIGQEVTARLKHKSELRRRLLPVDVECEQPLEECDIISSDGAKLGTLLPGQNGKALALVRLKEMSEAKTSEASMTAGGAVVKIVIPEWLALHVG